MRAALVPAAVFLALASSCRCGFQRSPPPERLLPADASLTLIVPRIRALQKELGPFFSTLQRFPAAADLTGSLPALRNQLGFDPLDPKALERAGIDPEGGAGVSLAPGTAPSPTVATPVLALPVADARRFEAWLGRLAGDRLGARARSAPPSDVGHLVTWSTREGAPSALAVLFTRGGALLAVGSDAPARLHEIAALPPPQTLAPNPQFTAARALLGKDQVAFAFAPPHTSAPPHASAVSQLPLARDGAALGLTASATHFALRAALLLPPGRAGVWGSAFAREKAGDPSRLPADTFLAMRIGGDPAVIGDDLTRYGGQGALAQRVASALGRVGLDLQRDLLSLLEPGLTASLALAPTFEVASVTQGADALASRDLFRLVHFTAELSVKDPARAAAALDALAKGAAQLDLTAERRTLQARPIWRLSRGAHALEVALDGKRLLVTGGEGRMDALLTARAGASYSAPTPIARAALRDGFGGAVLDLGHLVTSFRALPTSAYGTGPDAFVMRSLTERVVDPAAHLLAASLRFERAREGLRVDFTLEARPEERP